MKVRQIKTLEQLKKESLERSLECFIALNSVLRSSKTINWDDITGEWLVFNWIDDTEQVLASDAELKEMTNIVEALENGSLWTDEEAVG